MDALLLKIICQNIQYHILSGNDQLGNILFVRCQQGGVGVDILDRAGGVFMPGPCNVGIHIVLGKAHLPSDFVGMDLTPADQVINGGFTDMKNVGNFLGGKGFVLTHGVPSMPIR